MLSTFAQIFGGQQQQQQSTSTPVDMTPGAFKGLQGPLADMLLQYTKNQPQYSGPTVAPITAPEQGILSGMQNDQSPGQRQGYLGDVMSGKYLPGQGGNPFLDEAIRAAQRPTLEGLTETLGRTLPGRFTAAGQFTQPQGSSAFDRAAAIATRGAANALGDIATNMSFGNYESERGRQQQAVQLSQQEVDTTIKNLQAQGLPRMIQDLGIERGMAMFQANTQALLEALKLIGGVASPTIATQGQSTSTGENTPGAIAGFKNLFAGGGKQTLPTG